MKKFDLARAKAGEPLVTRDGRAARFIAHVPEFKPTYRVLVAVEGQSCAMAYAEDGIHSVMGGETDEDLFMATKKRTAYLNVYESRMDSRKGNKAGVFDTEELARENASVNLLRCLVVAQPIVIEE